ncbi:MULTISPECIES: DUF423 domain-containing protein [Pseudomonadaceae]|uniref:Small membrane protein n=1 Tax=Pseudomonas saudiphocaensis TaxID=1499686 RepID=A0A078LY24_9PSED|nr:MULTISPECIES: DUF423 domain-containing protein [Pseudomonadaceae]MCF6780224.1 DUF423 domain-containing protein [Stutzerimonas stutzeri]MCF6804839.1 DUF423 domain-containing protein [Stutzerimonas stutzeri]RRV17414.1 DUF423 domain-containing protein [Pseudomonas saudiphocaensis]CDZ94771.1 small membrane protein [Pseudomonas saudiphocaensis]
MIRPFLVLAAFFGLTGVALGAFAAHGLKSQLSAEYLAVFQTGVHYQLIHALALIGVALLALHAPSRLLSIAAALFVVGVLLFSGSLYLLTLTGIGKLGIITPIGGTAFLAGWFCLLLAGWKLRRC